MTTILGVSAHYHDSAACLVRDGRVVAAVHEEAFSRRKHDARFPVEAIRFCLDSAGLTVSDLDYYGYYELPALKRQRVAASARAVHGDRADAVLATLDQRQADLASMLPATSRGTKVYAVEHHLSHAASAFYPSPYEEAAIVTVDGVGEYTTTSIGRGRGNRVELSRRISFPHSLGLFYSAFTHYCGFRVNSGEYKLMGLAPYGTPRHTGLIEAELIRIAPDGSFRLNPRYFAYVDPRAVDIVGSDFEDLLGQPRRKPDDPLTDHYADVAASAQAVFEKAMLAIARSARELTGLRKLCLAGGGALNCVANRKIQESGEFDEVWVQPAAGDAGGSLGVALHLWHHHLGNPRTPRKGDSMSGSLLGPGFDDDAIRLTLDSVGARYHRLEPDQLVRHVAGLLAAEKIVGWYQGRMEFGPRALGNRSILADPRPAWMQRRLNLSIKFREGFRPFAPAVLAEHARAYFDVPGESPYMLFTAPVAESLRKPVTGATGLAFDTATSDLPAITHRDHSARLQTVDAGRNPLFHRLLSEFHRLTGVPVLVNTTFNVRGEPIVCTPMDALRCFLRTELDHLVVGSYVLDRADQDDLAVDLTAPIELD